jgi:hypothetical protein
MADGRCFVVVRFGGDLGLAPEHVQDSLAAHLANCRDCAAYASQIATTPATSLDGALVAAASRVRVRWPTAPCRWQESPRRRAPKPCELLSSRVPSCLTPQPPRPSPSGRWKSALPCNAGTPAHEGSPS